MIIVAEFIERDYRQGYRPFLDRAIAFMSHTQVHRLVVTCDEYWTVWPIEQRLCISNTTNNCITLTHTSDRQRHN